MTGSPLSEAPATETGPRSVYFRGLRPISVVAHKEAENDVLAMNSDAIPAASSRCCTEGVLMVGVNC